MAGSSPSKKTARAREERRIFKFLGDVNQRVNPSGGVKPRYILQKTFDTLQKPAKYLHLKLNTRRHSVFSNDGCQEKSHEYYFSPSADTLGKVIV
jgi:hypothetical protein